MLHAKHLCKLTVIFGPPTTTKTFKNMENPVYFECEYYRSLLFEMQYGDHCLIERVKTFKVVPVRGEV